MSLANQTGAFLGRTLGKFVVSGAVGITTSVLTSSTSIVVSTLRNLAAYGWISAEYLSKNLNIQQLGQFTSDIQGLVKTGKVKQYVADMLVNELHRINNVKMDIQKSVSSSTPENKSIIQESVQDKSNQSKSFFKMVKDGFQGNGIERK